MNADFLASAFMACSDSQPRTIYAANMEASQAAADRAISRVKDGKVRDEIETALSSLVFRAGLCGFVNGVGYVIDLKDSAAVRAAKSMKGEKAEPPKKKAVFPPPQPVIQLDMKSGAMLACYPSKLAAERATGVDDSAIGLCCKGERAHAGGFRWQYKT